MDGVVFTPLFTAQTASTSPFFGGVNGYCSGWFGRVLKIAVDIVTASKHICSRVHMCSHVIVVSIDIVYRLRGLGSVPECFGAVGTMPRITAAVLVVAGEFYLATGGY